MGMSYMPDFGQPGTVKAHPWLYTPILPLVFGAELSYMEQVAKLHAKVNELIQNGTITNENFTKLVQAFEAWEEFLNTSTVPDGAITSEKLADNAVTHTKLANASVTSRAIRDGSVLEQHLAMDSVGPVNLRINSVTNDKINRNAVTEDKISDGAVTGDKLADESIVLSKLSTAMYKQWDAFMRVIAALENGNGNFDTDTLNVRNGLTLAAQCIVNCGTAILHNLGEPVSDADAATKKYVDNALKNVSVGAMSITTDKLDTGAVTTPKIANGAVTSAKLDSAGVALPNGSTGTSYDGQAVPSLDDDTLATLGTMTGFIAWVLSAGTRAASFASLSLNGDLTFKKAANINFNTNQLHNVGDPVSQQDGTNKRYVDALIDGRDAFEAYDRFYHSISNMRVNPDSPLVVPTYDGSGHATHPCVRRYDWCGHKFWMGYTPYDMSRLELENPCLAFSDDGYNWHDDGIPNPLDPPVYVNGEQASMNSDVHLVPVGNTLEVWWRTNYWSNNPDGEYTTVSRRTSTDGVNWSAKEELFRVNPGAGFGCVCPVALYEDGIYKIWFVDPFKGLRYYESTTGKNWQYIRQIDVENAISPEHKVWHFDIAHTYKGYEFVGCYRPENDSHGNAYVFYAHSDDNISYSERTIILTPGKEGSFDSLQLYRPSFVRITDEVRVYYGAQDSTLQWNIGVITAPNPYLFNAVLETGKQYDSLKNRVNVLEAAKGSPVADGTTIVESFEVSPWVSGYWNPATKGEMTIYGNFHHTQLVPLTNLMVDGQLPEITAVNNVTSYPVLRVNYFDGNMRWIGFDSATPDSTQLGKQEPTPIRWYTGAVYVAISANSDDKSTIVVTSS